MIRNILVGMYVIGNMSAWYMYGEKSSFEQIDLVSRF